MSDAQDEHSFISLTADYVRRINKKIDAKENSHILTLLNTFCLRPRGSNHKDIYYASKKYKRHYSL
jgi:hypothetical protein